MLLAKIGLVAVEIVSLWFAWNLLHVVYNINKFSHKDWIDYLIISLLLALVLFGSLAPGYVAYRLLRTI